jgi:hypothetical protein
MGELSGQALIELAWRQQAIKPEGFAAAIIGFNCLFLLACAIAVSGRVWVRAWLYQKEKIWGWDDNLTVLSFVSEYRRRLQADEFAWRKNADSQCARLW